MPVSSVTCQFESSSLLVGVADPTTAPLVASGLHRSVHPTSPRQATSSTSAEKRTASSVGGIGSLVGETIPGATGREGVVGGAEAGSDGAEGGAIDGAEGGGTEGAEGGATEGADGVLVDGTAGVMVGFIRFSIGFCVGSGLGFGRDAADRRWRGAKERREGSRSGEETPSCCVRRWEELRTTYRAYGGRLLRRRAH
jgi:hypothetical protein